MRRGGRVGGAIGSGLGWGEDAQRGSDPSRCGAPGRWKKAASGAHRVSMVVTSQMA